MRYLLLLSFLVLSCTTDPEKDPELSGQWVEINPHYGFNLFVTQNGNTVSGTGQQGSNAVTVSGGVNYPNVVLNIVGPTVTHSFSGKFTDKNSVQGKVSNNDVVLTRQ